MWLTNCALKTQLRQHWISSSSLQLIAAEAPSRLYFEPTKIKPIQSANLRNLDSWTFMFGGFKGQPSSPLPTATPNHDGQSSTLANTLSLFIRACSIFTKLIVYILLVILRRARQNQLAHVFALSRQWIFIKLGRSFGSPTYGQRPFSQ